MKKRAPSKDAGQMDVVTLKANYQPSLSPGHRDMIVLPVLICFRLINAVCIKTFFQPDEYFQSLEPAWKIAFGSRSGAWITWEWQHQLRSSLHPAIFAALYLVAERVMESLAFHPQIRATILIMMPKLLQGSFAAIGDYFTWKFAERIYGRGSSAAWVTLFLTLLSPWQWFCSTRTLSNSLEAVLTIAALYFWPWELASGLKSEPSKSNHDQSPPVKLILGSYSDIFCLRLCLVLAGVASILRPTNLLIWTALVTTMITRVDLNGAFPYLQDLVIFFREAAFCGTLVISASAISDRLYFGTWTFPPYQWLDFNITQSLALFYGTNDWHYYLSQGLPLLLTTYIPFVIHALWSPSSLPRVTSPLSLSRIRWDLSFVVLTMITVLSIISHKEVRFIYPLLPCLHVLIAPHVLSFFSRQPPIHTMMNSSVKAPVGIRTWRLPLLIFIVITNIAIGFYTTQVHQRGVLDVLTFLRHEYEETHSSKCGFPSVNEESDHAFDKCNQGSGLDEVFAAFLMPCHSTPWRSHLVYPNLHAWALTCEPPLHIAANTPERALYRDEADRFYDDPDVFLRKEMNTTERRWPKHIVGFQGIESDIKGYCEEQMPGWEVKERWSGFNSHWHDDNRRKGRVVVWELVHISGS